MAAGNEPAEAAVRVNTLKADHLDLPVPTRPADHLPEGLIVDAPFDAFASPQWEQGLFMPQSRAAMAVARALDPQPGERILDLCAAPGGKTTHLAALIRNEGRITAVERHEGRAKALARTAERMGVTCVEVRTADATTPQETGDYDRVLVDPPCSDLGTLAARPDVRWRKHAETPAALAVTQGRILDRAAAALGQEACSSTPPARSHPPRTSRRSPPSSNDATTSRTTGCRPTCRSGTIRSCPAACRRSRTATGRTASSSRD